MVLQMLDLFKVVMVISGLIPNGQGMALLVGSSIDVHEAPKPWSFQRCYLWRKSRIVGEHELGEVSLPWLGGLA